MSDKAEKLVRKAQQIADNNSFTPDLDVVAQKVAEHIQKYWDPRMKQDILDYAQSDEALISDVVERAIRQIRVKT
ncbi:MAG: formate dehydrogenase subunit delta [Gammaproteobacteria bacterium]